MTSSAFRNHRLSTRETYVISLQFNFVYNNNCVILPEQAFSGRLAAAAKEQNRPVNVVHQVSQNNIFSAVIEQQMYCGSIEYCGSTCTIWL